jgi:hypothetical protein
MQLPGLECETGVFLFFHLFSLNLPLSYSGFPGWSSASGAKTFVRKTLN